MNPPQGEDAAPPPKDDDERQKNKEGDKPEDQNADSTDLNPQQARKDDKEQPKVSSTTCKPVATERPKVKLPSH